MPLQSLLLLHAHSFGFHGAIELHEAMKGAESSKDQHHAGRSNRPWPRWRILAIVGAVVLVAIGLGVGLGVGLTRKSNHHNDDSAQDNSDSDDPNSSSIPSGPNRTSTWQPGVNATWQIVLQSAIKLDNGTASPPDVSIWDLDLFDNNATTFKALQRDGKKVICYFSAGSYEDFRPDKGRFKASDLGKPLDGWPNERWLNLSSANVRSIMRDRIKLAWSKGCDAIDPDNVDGYVSLLFPWHDTNNLGSVLRILRTSRLMRGDD